jgi:hypothetical protein
MQITKSQLIKIETAKIRELQVQDGMFDGRFITKVMKTKKTYKRKPKHKNSLFD